MNSHSTLTLSYEMTHAPYDHAWGPLRRELGLQLGRKVWEKYINNTNWELTHNLIEDLAWYVD